MTAYAKARRNMVDGQLRTFDVSDRAVLAAMDELPREQFVPAGREGLAYLDRNVVVPAQHAGTARDAGMARDAEAGIRVILAPMVLARLLQALEIEAGESVLVVGGGLGYSAAVLGRLGAEVTMLESRDDLSAIATARFGELGLQNVRLRSGVLSQGCESDRPFDAILIDGTVEERPQTLLAQLADGGRLACLVGDGQACKAKLFVRAGGGFGERSLFDASAPLLTEFRIAPAFVF